MAAVALAANAAPRKLRVGVFADHALQPRWMVEALAKVAASGFAHILYLGIGAGAPQAQPWPWRVYGALDRGLFRAGEDPEAPLDLARYVAHVRRGALDAGPAALELDVVFALGAVDDRRLEGVARHGVWRFQADGLREVVDQAPLTRSALLVRLPGAEPRIAYQSWSRTDPFSLARNRARLLRKTSDFAWRALRELQRSGSAWLEQCRLQREAPAAADARRELSPFALAPRLGRRMLRRGLEKALRVEHWFLAFRFGGGTDARAIAPDLAGFTRIVPPRERIWADPFPIERNGRYFVFFEEARGAAGKGHISMLEITRDGRWSDPVRVLERDHHLSYPFLLQHQGELYMVPETGAKRTVEVWRCVDFPRRWRLERTLIEGVRLVDATFHRQGERWWMFAAGAPEGWSVNDELHIFHADHFLGEWRPHERNPVKSDVRASRPAGGLYWRNGALYRPAQICVPDYGSGLALHRVLRLTPHEYAERQVERVLPGAGLLGLHTVNCAGELTVVDAWARRSRFV